MESTRKTFPQKNAAMARHDTALQIKRKYTKMSPEGSFLKQIFEPTEKLAPSQRCHFTKFVPTGKFALAGKFVPSRTRLRSQS
jgi:hypothetical protein